MMKYVYILRSVGDENQRYIGITDDLRKRLEHHNHGCCEYTSKFMPWRVETYIAFTDSKRAIEFERYLKTGAGWAFSIKRF